ncbi:hypothetical protein E5288_WYG011507 [Bos mutus]|uniref:Uncharacterized protein n=1 Tax=Bos mutus TaxID=72004 RepID=A0A6B0RQP1_9CETA|nr:hypothetical protein [Bos mutus]
MIPKGILVESTEQIGATTQSDCMDPKSTGKRHVSPEGELEGLSVLPRKHEFLNHGIKVIIPWNKVMGRLLVQEISDLKEVFGNSHFDLDQIDKPLKS